MTFTESTAAIHVRGLTKRYGGRTVVDGVDLTVRRGEVFGLLGGNGAGKSTTVECLQGLRSPDGGVLRVLGLDPATQGDRLRGLVGSQLQSAGLPDRLRVAEAVALFAGKGAPGDELLETFGLAERRRSPFASLSGGEQQRLFLVLALLNRPQLVILDELTQGLDPAARRTVWDAVDRLRADGTTVLLVTHDVDEAEELCDAVAVLRDGRLIAGGTPREIVDGLAPWALMRMTGGPLLADLLAGVRGVREARADGGRVVVQGDRTMIAYVGAALQAAGEVPPDLSVRMPGLEDALVMLLATSAAPQQVPALAGSIR